MSTHIHESNFCYFLLRLRTMIHIPFGLGCSQRITKCLITLNVLHYIETISSLCTYIFYKLIWLFFWFFLYVDCSYIIVRYRKQLAPYSLQFGRECSKYMLLVLVFRRQWVIYPCLPSGSCYSMCMYIYKYMFVSQVYIQCRSIQCAELFQKHSLLGWVFKMFSVSDLDFSFRRQILKYLGPGETHKELLLFPTRKFRYRKALCIYWTWK